MRPSQEKSLRLHRAVLDALRADPDTVMRKARDNIAQWVPTQRADGRAVRYLRRWESLLDAGVDAVAETLVDPSTEASEMRAITPFAGVVSEERRLLIHEEWVRERTGGIQPSPAEIIARARVEGTDRGDLVARLGAMEYTFGQYDPTGGDSYRRGTWDDVQSAAGRGWLTEEEYDAIMDAAVPMVSGEVRCPGPT